MYSNSRYIEIYYLKNLDYYLIIVLLSLLSGLALSLQSIIGLTIMTVPIPVSSYSVFSTAVFVVYNRYCYFS